MHLIQPADLVCVYVCTAKEIQWKGTAVNCQNSLYFHDFGLLQFGRLSAYKKAYWCSGNSWGLWNYLSADIKLTLGPQETEVHQFPQVMYITH